MRKFPFTDLYGAAVHGALCGPVQVGGLSPLTHGVYCLVLLPLDYLIICTLLWCSHCTVLEVAPKCAQVSIPDLFSVAVREAFCGPVQVGGLSPPTKSLHI